MLCPTHQVEFKQYTSKTTNKPYMGHYVDGQGMCFPSKDTKPQPVSEYQGDPSWSKTPPISREPLKERDYDAENRGKVRHGIIVAMIQHDGLKPLDASDKMVIDELVEFVMKGV